MTRQTAPTEAQRNAHFEAICSYLASPLASEAGRKALLAEAEDILRQAPCTEDMIFGALIVAEDPVLADKIFEVQGLLGFDACDPFSRGLREGWGVCGLEEEDRSRLFGYIFNAHKELFSDNTPAALAYAIKTDSLGAIDLVMRELNPSDVDITKALTRHRGFQELGLKTVDAYLPLLKAATGSPDDWEALLQTLVRVRDTCNLAIIAKAGVDMTGFAQALKEDASTVLHPFLDMASSQHGRLALMQSLPDIRDLVTAPHPFIDEMIFSLDFPARKGVCDEPA